MSRPASYVDIGWNPVTGCSKGCPNCWARGFAPRLAGNPAVKHRERYEGFKPTCWPERLDEPLKWKKPRRVAVAFMADLFDPGIPASFIDRVFAVMAAAPRHTFLLLTKRPDRMAQYKERRGKPLSNVWRGTSVLTQADADKRIPDLLACPAAVHWVSYEPAIEYVTFTKVICETAGCGWTGDVGDLACDVDECGALDTCCPRCAGAKVYDRLPVDWLVMGAESGPGARPCKPNWARSVRDQCAAAGVPFYLKAMEIDGKMVSLPYLDGRQHKEMPT